jgi:hypothetical protein
LSRRDFEVFRFGTAMASGHYSGIVRSILRCAEKRRPCGTRASVQ